MYHKYFGNTWKYTRSQLEMRPCLVLRIGKENKPIKWEWKNTIEIKAHIIAERAEPEGHQLPTFSHFILNDHVIFW